MGFMTIPLDRLAVSRASHRNDSSAHKGSQQLLCNEQRTNEGAAFGQGLISNTFIWQISGQTRWINTSEGCLNWPLYKQLYLACRWHLSWLIHTYASTEWENCKGSRSALSRQGLGDPANSRVKPEYQVHVHLGTNTLQQDSGQLLQRLQMG